MPVRNPSAPTKPALQKGAGSVVSGHPGDPALALAATYRKEATAKGLTKATIKEYLKLADDLESPATSRVVLGIAGPAEAALLRVFIPRQEPAPQMAEVYHLAAEKGRAFGNWLNETGLPHLGATYLDLAERHGKLADAYAKRATEEALAAMAPKTSVGAPEPTRMNPVVTGALPQMLRSPEDLMIEAIVVLRMHEVLPIWAEHNERKIPPKVLKEEKAKGWKSFNAFLRNEWDSMTDPNRNRTAHYNRAKAMRDVLAAAREAVPNVQWEAPGKPTEVQRLGSIVRLMEVANADVEVWAQNCAVPPGLAAMQSQRLGTFLAVAMLETWRWNAFVTMTSPERSKSIALASSILAASERTHSDSATIARLGEASCATLRRNAQFLSAAISAATRECSTGPRDGAEAWASSAEAVAALVIASNHSRKIQDPLTSVQGTKAIIELLGGAGSPLQFAAVLHSHFKNARTSLFREGKAYPLLATLLRKPKNYNADMAAYTQGTIPANRVTGAKKEALLNALQNSAAWIKLTPNVRDALATGVGSYRLLADKVHQQLAFIGTVAAATRHPELQDSSLSPEERAHIERSLNYLLASEERADLVLHLYTRGLLNQANKPVPID